MMTTMYDHLRLIVDYSEEEEEEGTPSGGRHTFAKDGAYTIYGNHCG